MLIVRPDTQPELASELVYLYIAIYVSPPKEKDTLPPKPFSVGINMAQLSKPSFRILQETYDDDTIVPVSEIVQPPLSHHPKIPQHETKSGRAPFRLPDYYLHFLHDEDDLTTGILFS